MCNLYRMTKGIAEVAGLFRVLPQAGGNFGEEVYPGYPGVVVADGQARTMTWGFPLAMTGKRGQPLKPRPVNNARTDKLAGAFWRSAFETRRCLIPVSAWAEARGPRGRMTRTWLSLPDAPLFALAGVWRPTSEWGDAYAMIMTDACVPIADVHDRMPVILATADHETWLRGSPAAAFDLCRPWSGPIAVDHTPQPWRAAPTR